MPETRPADGTVTWRALWSGAAAATGDRVVARWLCEHASGFERDEFDGALDEPATQRQVAHLDVMTARVAAGDPVQYVMGRWAFRHLDVMVDGRVLIPRPETELIVEHVLAFCGGRRRDGTVTIADLGTGSGVIGLSLLAELPAASAEVWMTDESAAAIDVARANAAGIGRAAVHARFAVGNWCDALPESLAGQLDVIVSNPPYVALDDPHLEDSVRSHEPHGALFAGPDGLDDVRVIVEQAPRWLAPGGMLIIEIGRSQGADVVEMFTAAGFDGVVLHHDLAGHDRFVAGLR
jgi:release factor glutamine methyltransferase